MKIMLVNPDWVHGEYFGRFDEARSVEQPLGIAYLASVLEIAGHHVRLVDAPVKEYSKEDIMREIESFNPDLIGLSPTTVSFSKALAIAKEAKVRLDLPTIVGGPHVTALPEQSAQEECFDVVVVGEGEATMVELAERLESSKQLGDVKGIAFKEGGGIRRNPPRPFIEDIDSLPFPARHLLPPLDAYHATPTAYKCSPQATMITSRGCPYRCTFCDRSVFGNIYRARSAKNVLDEIQLLIERDGAQEIRFWDEMFNADTRRVLDICSEIKKRGIEIPWTCRARMDRMNREVLRAMADSGCWQIEYGIESGNQRLLDGVNKGLTLDMIREVARMTHEAGISIRGNFMLGLPGETEETMRETIEFAKQLQLSSALFHITTPFPGTELYEKARESGELDPGVDWDNYSLYSLAGSPYVPKGLTREIMERYQFKAYREFYLRPSFILRKVLAIRRLSDLGRYFTGFRVVRNLQRR